MSVESTFAYALVWFNEGRVQIGFSIILLPNV